MLAEQAAAGGADMGRRDQQRHRAMPPQPGEIDQPDQQVAQRVDPQRVELVGREQMQCQVEREGTDPAQPDRAAAASLPDRLPDALEQLPRTLRGRPAHQPQARATALTAPAEVPLTAAMSNRVLLEQPVEHAPGEGAVRAATLQRQADLELAVPGGGERS